MLSESIGRNGGYMMDVRNQTLRVLRDYVYILIGAAITAVSFNVFLLPNKIAAGGVSGI
ncbi:YitT family protein, partial [Bacillus inaquosorum]|nr:YitT family protein [Bacillus inaquosorum]